MNMKKKIVFILAITIFVSLLLAGAYKAGINHALKNSEHFIVEMPTTNDGTVELYIDLDGECYVTTLFIC